MAEIKPDSEPTVELLARVRSGEQAAFEGLFARHRPWLRQLIEWRLDDRLNARIDPSDVVQETQLEAYRRLDDYLEREPMPFRLWLRKTLDERLTMLERRHLGASRRAVDREAANREGWPADGKSAWLVDQLTGGDPSPSQVFVRDELARRVREAIAALPDLDREILLLRTFEALSYGEAAYLLAIDEATARKRHGRALLRLHQLLAKNGLTESQVSAGGF
ncbi:MAG TPA: sigma-70 family RNA polymerase sigma factor [Pirellulales bacterium]|jgi:RNA polymerase sigma-70 factor (ECF subfamily)|nr:sigma-70 family RNA polymerase sigma factor [Pirellulales bacterium]